MYSMYTNTFEDVIVRVFVYLSIYIYIYIYVYTSSTKSDSDVYQRHIHIHIHIHTISPSFISFPPPFPPPAHPSPPAELLTTNKLSELACLALYLMYEKKRGRHSFWFPFIHELDRQRGRGQLAVESPLLWTEGEIEEYLAGSPTQVGGGRV